MEKEGRREGGREERGGRRGGGGGDTDPRCASLIDSCCGGLRRSFPWLWRPPPGWDDGGADKYGTGSDDVTDALPA